MPNPPLLARVPYTKRPVPPSYSDAWFGTELGNIQRAIPSTRVYTAKTDYTATAQDNVILVNATNGAITITLPRPDQTQGLALSIKKIDVSANAVTMVGQVDGVTNPTLTAQYESLSIVSDGTQYYLLATV